MTRMFRTLLKVVLVWCCLAPGVRAEEALGLAPVEPAPAVAPAVARSREHYLEGSRWLELGEWARALAAYEQAFALHPSASTLFNMAYCNSQLGRLVLAWLHVSEALRLSESGNEHRLAPERRAAVEEERERLRSRVPSILFQGPGVLEVNVFGGQVQATKEVQPVYYVDMTSSSAEAWSEVPPGTRILIDPGSHRLTVRSGGRLFPRDLVLAEGETVVVATPRDEVESPNQQLPQAEMASNPAKPASASAERPGPRPTRTIGVASLVLGGASFAAALVATGFLVDAESALSGQCDGDGTCPESLAPKVNQYQSAALAANVGIIAGLTASTLGVGLIWLDHRSERRQMRLEVGLASLHVRGRF